MKIGQSSYPPDASKKARHPGASGRHLETGREKTAMDETVNTEEQRRGRAWASMLGMHGKC